MKGFTLIEFLIVVALVSLFLSIAPGAEFLYPDVSVTSGTTYGTCTVGRISGFFTLKYLKVVPDTYSTGTLKLQILTEAGQTFYESGTITSGTAAELITNTDTYPAKPVKSNWTIKLLHSSAVTSNKTHRIYYLLE